MPQSTDGQDELSSVKKTFDVLEALWELDGATISELTNELDLPSSTVHIHLKTLRSKGYVYKDNNYRLSLRFLTFGEHVRESHPLSSAAPEPVQDLADKTGERVLCMTEQFGLATILSVAEGEQSIRTDVDIGTNAYLHCSAGGKAILAHYPKEKTKGILDKWGLPKLTENTITDREIFLEELNDIREKEVAVAKGEYFEGVMTIGVPIQSDDTVHGAVVVLGPSQRLYNNRTKDELYEYLLAAANTIEVNLRLDNSN